MMTFRKFWHRCWNWFIGMIIVGLLLAVGAWGIWWYYLVRTPKYERDFFLCLQGKEAEFYPERTKQTVKSLEFFLSVSEPEKGLKALADAQIFRTITPGEQIFRTITPGEQKEKRVKVINAFRVFSDLGLLMNDVIVGLIKLDEMDSSAPGKGIFAMIRDSAKREKVIKAIKGELADDELPKIGSHRVFLFWSSCFIWCIVTFSSFIAYLYWTDDYNERWYEVPWHKLGTYAVILFWLPGVIFPAIILGICKGIIALGNIQIGRRVEETEIEAQRTRISEPERGREQEPQPTPPRKWYIVEGLNEEKGLFVRERIAFSEISITTPLELTGLAFPDNERERVFNVLGVRPVNLKEIPTNRKNLFLLQYEDIEKFREKAKKRFREEKEKCQSQYIELCQERIKREISQSQQDIESLSKKLQEHSQGIVENTRTISVKQEQLQTLERLVREKADTRKFSEEFDGLCSLPQVEWVEVKDETIKVFTDTVLVEHQSRKYEIGSFEIAISLRGLIRMRNLENQIEGYDHPHIKNGIPCLGNISEGIAKLIANYQFSVTIQILIKFLHQVNPTGWYTSIEQWKEV